MLPLANWVTSPKIPSAPPLHTFAYHFINGVDDFGQQLGATLYPNLLPQRLHSLYSWKIRLGGDGLIHANSKKSACFPPFLARPQNNYPAIFK